MCLQFLWLLASSSSPLHHALPTLGSANSANSVNNKTTGPMNRMKSNIWTYVGIYFEPISSGIKFSLDFYVWCQMLLISWCVLSHFSHVWLSVTLWTVACQAPLSMGFSRQEYWSGLPCPPPEGLPNPGIEPMSPMAPALQADSLPLSHWGSPSILVPHNKKIIIFSDVSVSYQNIPQFLIFQNLKIYLLDNLLHTENNLTTCTNV